MVKCLWGLPEGACTWFLSTWATLATFSTATWATSAAFSTASQTASATTRTVVAFYTTNRPSSLAISSSWRSCKYYCACTNMLELSNMVNKVKAARSWRICALRKLVAAISAVAWAWALMVHFLCFSNFYSIYAIWELQGHDGLLPPLLRKSPSPWASTSGSSLSSVMTTARGGEYLLLGRRCYYNLDLLSNCTLLPHLCPMGHVLQYEPTVEEHKRVLFCMF